MPGAAPSSAPSNSATLDVLIRPGTHASFKAFRSEIEQKPDDFTLTSREYFVLMADPENGFAEALHLRRSTLLRKSPHLFREPQYSLAHVHLAVLRAFELQVVVVSLVDEAR